MLTLRTHRVYSKELFLINLYDKKMINSVDQEGWCSGNALELY